MIEQSQSSLENGLCGSWKGGTSSRPEETGRGRSDGDSGYTRVCRDVAWRSVAVGGRESDASRATPGIWLQEAEYG